MSILVLAGIVAFLTSWQHGYFTLGILGGGFVAIVSVAAYKMLAGTVMCRVILAAALTALLAISIQQSNGLGEGHFVFFLNFTILIRYRDIVPVLVLVGLTLVHHFTITYCQSIGVELWGEPLTIFSWGTETEWGLLAPLLYHLIIAVLSLVISTFYIYEGNRAFVESGRIIGAVEKAATGDLTVRINETVETTLIAKVNTFFEHINSMFSQINQVTRSLKEQASETNATASARTERSYEQQQEVTMVATAVTQMAAAAQEIASNAVTTAGASNDMVSKSNEGKQISTASKKSIEKLATRVTKASEIISELEQNSQQISSIVATITGIAEQTNLLALNAAIEAARAGEQGRGFAVVADEVRVLSQRTHDSTQEISGMIDTLQSTTTDAVNTMSGCHELATGSVEDVQLATQGFEAIAESIQNISDMATQIATAAEQQTSVTEEINKNTTSLSSLSEEFLNESQDSSERAAQLENQASSIDALVQEFKLN